MEMILALPLSFIGGVLYRARGGGVETGSTQANRLLFWVLPCAALALWYMWPADDWFSAVMLTAFALTTWGAASFGHAVGMVFDVGHLGDREPGHWQPKDGKWYDTASRWPLKLLFGSYDPYWNIRRKYAYMAFGGFITGFTRGLPWLLLGFWLLPIISAAGWVLAYWAGWQWIGHRKVSQKLAGQTEWGEFLYGAIVFYAVSVYIMQSTL